MEAITSSLLRNFSENLLVKNNTILTKPAEQSPREYVIFQLCIIVNLEIQLLVDLDVVRPIAVTNPRTSFSTGFGQYECFICALEKRYYRYTRKATFEDHFLKHSTGEFKSFIIST